MESLYGTKVTRQPSIFMRMLNELSVLRSGNRELRETCDRLVEQNKELLEDLIAAHQDFERSFGQACPHCGHTERTGGAMT